MKNYKSIILAIALMLFTAFGVSGCLFAVDTPILTRNGSIITWQQVDKASSYEVVLSGGTDEFSILTSENKYDLAEYLLEGKWDVKVKAKTTQTFYKDSEFSSPITFSVANALNVPQALDVVQENELVVTASWNAVEGATSYTIKAYKENDSSDAETMVVHGITSANIQTILPKGGTYKIAVRANSDEFNGEEGVFISSYCKDFSFTFAKKLYAPNVRSFIVNAAGGYILTWDAVDGATAYNVTLFGTDKILTTTSTSVDVLNISGGLPSIVKTNGIYNKNLQIAYVQAVGDGKLKLTSDYSLGLMCYAQSLTQSNIARNLGNLKMENFYAKYDGLSEFDFCADTQEELNSLVTFAIAYRIKELKFYHNVNGGDNALQTAFDNYPEMLSLVRSRQSNGFVDIKIDYYTPNSPTYTADTALTTSSSNITNNITTQTQFKSIDSFSKNPRSDDANYSVTDLPIYSRTKKISVYTSEQLFMAIQAGYMPMFSGACGAKYVWDEACKVSASIIDDNMTDYEKVEAIFDWICYTNRYDYNLYSYTEKENDLKKRYFRDSIWTNRAAENEYEEIEDKIRNFKGFFSEGMFFDGGQAVCDGISKTFVILCGVENIDAFKVNGTANGGGHAWNKVALDLNGDSVSEWYTIDCTWNDATIEDNTSGNIRYRKELLTKSYFLVTDDFISSNHTEEWPNLSSRKSTTEFNYFTYSKFEIDGETYDLYFNEDSKEEISKIITYLCNSRSSFVYKVENGYIGTILTDRGNYIADQLRYRGWAVYNVSKNRISLMVCYKL